MNPKFSLLLFLLYIGLAACNNGDRQTENVTSIESAPAILNYTVIKSYPHDTSFFTEGLEFHDGKLLESSGGQKEDTPHPSAFGVADLKTGKVEKKVELDNGKYFGEGITAFNGKIYQLTWQNHKGFIYDAKTFKKIKEFDYQGEGWSLTHDSSHLIMSNGSSNLQFLDPESLKVVSIVSVTDNNGPVSNINELEYIDGYLYANVWQSNQILKIDPASGKVIGKIDLSTLFHEAKNKSANADVLNGIAYNPSTKTIYVTGKLWPMIFEIRIN